jgi:16S rRNA processing protein RimM
LKQPQSPELTAPGPSDAWVWLAHIRRPQGRRGEVFADILTDFPEKFAQRRQLWLLSASKESGAAVAATSSSSPRIAPRAAGSGAVAPPLPRAMELIAHWLHKGGIVFHFAGINSISDAETLSGLIVAVPREARVALAEDEVYIGDLIGCTLVDMRAHNAVVVGVIEDVDRNAGPVPLLVVQGSGGEVLVPFAKSYLRTIDLDAKRVEMQLPEGLTDLNAAQSS